MFASPAPRWHEPQPSESPHLAVVPAPPWHEMSVHVCVAEAHVKEAPTPGATSTLSLMCSAGEEIRLAVTLSATPAWHLAQYVVLP